MAMDKIKVEETTLNINFGLKSEIRPYETRFLVKSSVETQFMLRIIFGIVGKSSPVAATTSLCCCVTVERTSFN